MRSLSCAEFCRQILSYKGKMELSRMLTTFKTGSRLTGCSSALFQVRHKRTLKPYRSNWKPIPPRTHRYDYFMERPPIPSWEKVISDFKASRLNYQPEEPTPMNVVSRCKHLIGQPRRYKEICEKYGIHEKLHKQVVVPSTYTVNSELMEVKHLIRVKPLKTPDGLPGPDDVAHTHLKTDGTLSVIKRLVPVPETDLPTSPPTHKLSAKTINKRNRVRCDQHKLLATYFKTKYLWKYNEDGKEYPYRSKIGD